MGRLGGTGSEHGAGEWGGCGYTEILGSERITSLRVCVSVFMTKKDEVADEDIQMDR